MMIVSREEANKLINVDSNLFKGDERNNDIVSEFIDNIDYETLEIKHGRSGVANLTPEERLKVATLAITSGLTNEEVSKVVGLHKGTVDNYRIGKRADGSGVDSNLREGINEVKGEIKTAAQNKLKLAIEALTGDKISGAKARDIAGIAKDMSAIIKDMTPNSDMNIQNSKVVIYQPRMKEEDDFSVIDVSSIE